MGINVSVTMDDAKGGIYRGVLEGDAGQEKFVLRIPDAGLSVSAKNMLDLCLEARRNHVSEICPDLCSGKNLSDCRLRLRLF